MVSTASYIERLQDIVEIFREEFGRGNDFCKNITYETSWPGSIGGIARKRARRVDGLLSSAAVCVPLSFTQASRVAAASQSASVSGP